MLRNALFSIGLMMISMSASADIIKSYIPQREVVGQARLNYLLWDIYDATLYAENGVFKEGKPFALELQYLREIPSARIAKRSVKEMRQQGFTDEVKLSAWYNEIRRIFPDVDAQTKLTGIYKKDAPTLFYKNGEPIGKVSDPEFGEYFFDIWLSENTSEPEMRQKLLGEK